jgi:hypothetical protein
MASTFAYVVTVGVACMPFAYVTPATAQEATVAAPAPPPTAPDSTAPGSTEPPPPDVTAGERSDGRLDPPPRRTWRLAPQVLLFPLRALFWTLRWPVSGALTLEDRHHAYRRVVDVFTWSGGTRGLRPAFYYSTVTIPEFGLKYFDHRSLGFDTRLDITATTGGAHYVYTDLLLEPTPTSAPIGVTFDLSFDRRGDLIFNGLGSHTYSNAATGRYLMNGLESHLVLRVRPIHGLSLFATFATGLKRFGNGDAVGGNPGIIYVYDTSTIPGFEHGTTYVRTGAGFYFDLRDTPLRSTTGLVLRGAFDYSHGIDGDVATYERLSAMLGIPIDVWQGTHVLWFSATTALTWPNDAPVPFSELPTLGGPNDLRGFRFQDFRDHTAFFVTAEYRWPLWMWVDAALFFDYGGVFGVNYEGFGTKRMQPDVGIALRLAPSRQFYIRMQLGYGFGEGFNFSIAGGPP